uniref:PC-esterase domain-containing protein 1A n=1 Tax=Naja naja TaxID=35670 RepID=A0A8C6VEC2_NAJNA
MLRLNSQDVHQLLHNKFVDILGDSIQRSVYKYLIQLLQSDSLLTSSQMKSKGEFSFENDHLIEGGVLDGLHNGIRYQEVRQYRACYHLIHFYFLTWIYSEYFESILEDFRVGLQPDVLNLNSCIWDVSRYGPSSMMEYRKNLEIAFNKLDADLPPSCLVIWNMTMPLGPRIKSGFLIPELQHLSQTLCQDIIEGNFYGGTLAGLHLFDMVDLHFHFCFDMGNSVKDGIHWDNVVHRWITNLLLTQLANAWRVVIPKKNPWGTKAGSIGASWSIPRQQLDGSTKNVIAPVSMTSYSFPTMRGHRCLSQDFPALRSPKASLFAQTMSSEMWPSTTFIAIRGPPRIPSCDPPRPSLVYPVPCRSSLPLHPGQFTVGQIIDLPCRTI